MTDITYVPSQWIKAIYSLIRIMPVLSWGISSSMLGLGFAYAVHKEILWLDYLLILLLIILIHGVVSHALNDLEDWKSGTDQLSPGILSGGSGVIRRKQYNIDELSGIARAGLLLTLIVSGYFVWTVGPSILIIPGIAVWSAIAYSCTPFRFSYYPLTGEWLCGFPAVFSGTVGTFYVLTRTIEPAPLIAGGIHALLAIGLLMHHHISDIHSDLQAVPRKLTTVAWVSLMTGIKATPLVELFYFLLALIAGAAGGLYYHPVLWITVPAALGCIGTALTTNPEDIISITRQEYLLYCLIIGDALAKTTWLFYM